MGDADLVRDVPEPLKGSRATLLSRGRRGALLPIGLLLSSGLAVGGLPSAASAQDAPPRCRNCDEAETVEILMPADSAGETHECALTLQLSIDEEGEADLARDPEGGSPLCAARAREWVERTRWEPATRGGRSAAVEVSLPLSFMLDREVAPRCVEGCDAEDILRALDQVATIPERRYGERVPSSRLDCALRVGLRLERTGEVTESRIESGGDGGVCDRAARRWAERTRWTPAYTDGVPVDVWFVQTVTITRR